MKIIQIPTTSNPFIVNINNNVYQYRAGETIEVPDEVAEVIKDTLALEPKPNPSGYSKIATLTVKKAADGTLPSVVRINADDNGSAFRVKDFFLKMKLAHTIEGVTTGKLIIRGVVNDISDTRCCSGYCQLTSLSKGTFNQYYAKFTTHGNDGGLLMVSKDPLGVSFKYGSSPNFSGESTYICPTEPDVSLDEGINCINAIMVGADWAETPFAEGCTFELWGVRV